MEKIKYTGNGQRIDIFLKNNFPYSRNFFHHIIERGGIKIENLEKKIKKSYILQNGQIILIDDLQRYLSPLVLDEAPQISIPIIHEEQDYLIINKPKGVLSHPNSIRDVNKPSVVGFLYHNFKDLPSFSNFIRAGLIHRLDKDTDGLMLIAKTEKGLSYFKNLFQQKSKNTTIQQKELAKIKKFYQAKCFITKQGEEFTNQIKDNLPHYIQEIVYAKVPNPNPKIGITKILNFHKSTFQDIKNILEIEVEILTGRTHQIRYHLSKNGLPIIGDYLYSNDEKYPMQLTAYKLEFEDLNGKRQSFQI